MSTDPGLVLLMRIVCLDLVSLVLTTSVYKGKGARPIAEGLDVIFSRSYNRRLGHEANPNSVALQSQECTVP